MGFYVPWVINGSKHAARLFRRTFQQQVGEGSGVDRPADLKVQALNVPGTGFRVAPGGGVAQSRDTSASSRESYGPILDSEFVVPSVPGTGSQGGRRDLVILEITDPEMESKSYPEPVTPEGWQDGDNFVRVTVIPNVDSLVPAAQRPVKRLEQITTGEWAHVTGVTLAAINWPASTGTITNAMIEDLREVHSPKWSIETVVIPLVSDDTTAVTSTAQYPNGQPWPANAAERLGRVKIPLWASVMNVSFDAGGVKQPAGNAWGGVWVRVGENNDPLRINTQECAWDTPGVSGNSRIGVLAGGRHRIPDAWRGTSQSFVPHANRKGGPSADGVVLDAFSVIRLQVHFLEQAV